MAGADFVSSIREKDLEEGQMKAVRIKGKPVLLVRQGGEVFGLSNRCPHMGCPLDGGILTDYLVMCPCHGWKFNIKNGQYTENALTALVSYRCKIENGKIFVAIQR